MPDTNVNRNNDIVRSPGSVQVTQPCQIFTEQGGTIGRAQGNTWIIADPDRFISSTHSQIAFENGCYYLLDLSTNGTLYNGAREPIGSGNRVALKDGDRFTLRDYEFLVSMRSPSGSPAFADPFGPGTCRGRTGSAGGWPPHRRAVRQPVCGFSRRNRTVDLAGTDARVCGRRSVGRP